MLDPERTAPAALADPVVPPAASASDAEPAGANDQSTPAAAEDDISRTIRNLEARHGREIAEANRRAQEAQQALVQSQQRLSQIEQHIARQMSAAQQAAVQQRIEQIKKLPADQQPAAYFSLQQSLNQQQMAAQAARQVAQSQAQAQSREYTQQEIDEYTARRKREIIDEANREYGLSGDHAIAEVDDLDDDSEDAYRASARTLARARRNGAAVARSNGSSAQQPPASPANVGGRSNAARPAASTAGRGPVNTEQQANRIFESTAGNFAGGQKERRKQLQELREQARSRVSYERIQR